MCTLKFFKLKTGLVYTHMHKVKGGGGEFDDKTSAFTCLLCVYACVCVCRFVRYLLLGDGI